MNCSTPGLPVHHQFLESTQPHAHRVGDAIQPSPPLSSPSPPAPNPSQHQGLFQRVNSSHEVARLGFVFFLQVELLHVIELFSGSHGKLISLKDVYTMTKVTVLCMNCWVFPAYCLTCMMITKIIKLTKNALMNYCHMNLQSTDKILAENLLHEFPP